MIVLEPYLFRGFYEYDPDLGFRVRPQAGGSNRLGFNDRDYSLTPPAGTVRLLFVGDSFSWAGGLEGNYTAILERKFEAHYGEHRVDIVNTGFPMTHTGEQLAMLEKYGLQYNPHMVVLAFFIGNDFVDFTPNRKRIVVNDTYLDIDARSELILFGYPIVPKSRLLHFVKQKVKILSALVAARAEAKPLWSPQDQEGTFSHKQYLDIELKRLVAFKKSFVSDARVALVQGAVLRMRTLLEVKGVEFAVALFPEEFQVDASLLSQLFEAETLQRQEFDLDLLQNILIKLLTSEQIPYVDLTSRFRAAGQTSRLYLLRDSHWNEAGNRLAADALFEYLLPKVEELLEREEKLEARAQADKSFWKN